MTDYVHHTAGTIDVGPGPLPRAWGNASGLYRANAAGLRARGWLPVEYENAAYDPAYQSRTGPVGCNVGDAVEPDAEAVTGVYTVANKTGVALAIAISEEMERRMITGVVLSDATVADGVRFRCDRDGLIRITGLKDAGSGDFPLSFRTHSGALVTAETQAEAAAIHGEVLGYVAALISASATLQGQALGATFTGNPQTWDGWPGDGS